jgi:hypothetical protein
MKVQAYPLPKELERKTGAEAAETWTQRKFAVAKYDRSFLFDNTYIVIITGTLFFLLRPPSSVPTPRQNKTQNPVARPCLAQCQIDNLFEALQR